MSPGTGPKAVASMWRDWYGLEVSCAKSARVSLLSVQGGGKSARGGLILIDASRVERGIREWRQGVKKGVLWVVFFSL